MLLKLDPFSGCTVPASLEQATESGRTPQFWGQVKLNKGPGLRVPPNIQSTPSPLHVSPETLTESCQVWVNTNWVSWHRNVGKRWAAGFGLPSESNTTNSWPRSVLLGRKRAHVLCDGPEGQGRGQARETQNSSLSPGLSAYPLGNTGPQHQRSFSSK